MMNDIKTSLLVLGSLVLSATFAVAQTTSMPRDQVKSAGEVKLRGTIEAIDLTARTVTIRGDKGSIVTIDVPKSVVRFEELKIGDVVSGSYYDRVNVRRKPAGEGPVDRTEPPLTVPTPGALPGATVVSQREATVTLTGWDPATRTVTFTAPNGAVYSRRLVDTADPSIVAGIKLGDRVDVTRTEAVNLAVESRTSVTATSDDFRHRFTISALAGWDNQFSGNLIEEASGGTTTGLPINLTETTFDDVYGRMGLFKIGIGYRLTPRTEGVFNLAISRSSAERIQIGTAGPGNTPLFVDFDDYNYWGVELGQRFFFARTRFTPFLGYLVGLNRHDDIRATFVDVPPASTPGLAAQDGKFFEKSWAFSFGPTGGFLIGIGPLELMAETQLRYMGGLSDVDWLVEEGLRDINSESRRWSFPVLVGLRIRF